MADSNYSSLQPDDETFRLHYFVLSVVEEGALPVPMGDLQQDDLPLGRHNDGSLLSAWHWPVKSPIKKSLIKLLVLVSFLFRSLTRGAGYWRERSTL